MKTLYLIRHAKSDRSDPFLSDFDRPLNGRGEKHAPMMAERLARAGARADLILSSPAARARATALAFAAASGYPARDIRYDRALYLADAETLIASIRRVEADVRTLWVFGHNPGLTECADALCGCGIDNIPTCGMVAMTFETDTWEEIGPGAGHFTSFDYPKKPL